MRVLICDDHAVFADSLALVLAAAGHRVAGVAYSPDEVLGMLPEAGADVCLVDLRFPDGPVLDRLPELVAAAPGTRFVMLSGFLDAGLADACVAAGVSGFAHKGQQVDEIVDLLARVHGGETVVDTVLGRDRVHGTRTEAQRLADYLTPREREVLTRLVRGENTTTLARTMHITRSTARSHVQSVLTKLGVHSQREAVITAARHGLIDIRTGDWPGTTV